MNANLPIKSWALEDRPREKLISKGLSSLSDAELIAILIGTGTKEETAVDLAKRMLASASNNLNELGKQDIKQLTAMKGIGEAKAISIIAALELGRRRKMADVMEKAIINGSSDVFELFHGILGDLVHEEFWVLYLNRSNKIIDKMKISQGGIAGTVTDIRMILKSALEKLASSIILCHNHPSGNIKPSENDIQVTKKLKEAASLMDISVLDHIIVTDSAYFSFADEGRM
jgi:DNA repair protein RadC